MPAVKSLLRFWVDIIGTSPLPRHPSVSIERSDRFRLFSFLNQNFTSTSQFWSTAARNAHLRAFLGHPNVSPRDLLLIEGREPAGTNDGLKEFLIRLW